MDKDKYFENLVRDGYEQSRIRPERWISSLRTMIEERKMEGYRSATIKLDPNLNPRDDEISALKQLTYPAKVNLTKDAHIHAQEPWKLNIEW